LTRRLSGALQAQLRERRSGLAVALLGPDGCGKSTLSARVAQEYYFPVRSVYMGLWQRTERAGNGAALPGLSLAGRLLRVWRQYIAGQYHRWRGRLVIFDRYTYDALLPSGGKRTALARLYAWTLGHACPSPDLILLLDAPGEVMYARKHESSPEQLEAQRQGFLTLQGRVPQLQVIDATCPQDAVRAEVVDRIWSRALARQ
jgi:thymidylate kinase